MINYIKKQNKLRGQKKSQKEDLPSSVMYVVYLKQHQSKLHYVNKDTIKGETRSNIRGRNDGSKDREKWRAIVQDRSFLADNGQQ